MSTCLTVENAQSHVTAFQPISEAARSWSDDNSRCRTLLLTLEGARTYVVGSWKTMGPFTYYTTQIILLTTHSPPPYEHYIAFHTPPQC